MKDFYYQIKLKHRDPEHNPEKEGYDNSTWSCPQLRGLVKAENIKEARKQIKEEFENDFNKKNDILLSVIEITSEKQYLRKFFEEKTCLECRRTFTEAEFNTVGCFCCYTCGANHRLKIEEQLRKIYDENVTSIPVVYRIYNRKNGKNYIGQTVRSFILRWWEHYHNWMKHQKDCDISDFTFEILFKMEEYERLQYFKIKDILSEKEQFYINQFDSIQNGYNSINAKSKIDNEEDECLPVQQ